MIKKVYNNPESQLRILIYVLFYLSIVITAIFLLFSNFKEDKKYYIAGAYQSNLDLIEHNKLIWQYLKLEWQQFWADKISVHLALFYQFLEKLYNELEVFEKETSRESDGTFLAFYNKFLQDYPDWQSAELDAPLHFYRTDLSGKVQRSPTSWQPKWNNLNSLNLQEVSLYLNNESSNNLGSEPSDPSMGRQLSKVLKNRDTPIRLYYKTKLGIVTDTSNVLLAFFVDNFPIREQKFSFVVSMELDNAFGMADMFFRVFAKQLDSIIEQTNRKIQPEIMLQVLRQTNDKLLDFYTHYISSKTQNNLPIDALTLSPFKLNSLNSNLQPNTSDFLPGAVHTEIAKFILEIGLPKYFSEYSPVSMVSPDLHFLLGNDTPEQAGKHLKHVLETSDYIQPFSVSNFYKILEQEEFSKDYIPRIFSVGKMPLLPMPYNLVILDSFVRPPSYNKWWTVEPFLSICYRQDLWLIVILFFIIIFIPLVFYIFSIRRYTKRWIWFSQYVEALPTPDKLIKKTTNGEFYIGQDFLMKIIGLDESFPKQSLEHQVTYGLQQRFLKLAETVEYWREQSYIDGLTGLLNRKGLNITCEHEFSRMQRSGYHFALILVDIDHFKNINDQYSHEIGDLILKSMADLFVSTFRNSDYIGRWGGEEFLIILPSTVLQGAIRAAKELRLGVEKMLFQLKEKWTLHLTISLGIATSENQNSFRDIFNLADKNLYLAKNNGRNQAWGFSQEQGHFCISVE